MIFVYGLIDPRTAELRYVGKTRKGMVRPKQHWDKHTLLRRRDKCHNWIRKLLSLQLLPEIVILEECDLEVLNDLEIFWIASLRVAGANLLNMTDGGEGGAPILNEESRARLSHKAENNPFFGRKHSSETRERISAAKKGKPGRKGVPKPPGTGAKIADKLRGRKVPRDQVEKMSAKLSRSVKSGDLQFPSIKAAAEHFKISPGFVAASCRGKIDQSRPSFSFVNSEHLTKRKWKKREGNQ